MSIISLPNVRRLFVPDRGMMIADADLAGADAMVVAAEARDQSMLDFMLAGGDLHSRNATEIWGHAFTSTEGTTRRHMRQQCKQATHATNYGSSANNLALVLKWPKQRVISFQQKWFTLHPGILEWHERTKFNLSHNRTITNKFGYRIIYFDRIDSVFTQALAWLPQSTVAEVCFRGAINLFQTYPWCEPLLQVHDSIVFQFPIRYHEPEWLDRIKAALSIPIPYPVPLSIPWGMSTSEKSWGHCK